jgi:molecular chaperone HtpG
MEWIMKAQTLKDISMGNYMSNKKTFGINLKYCIMIKLCKRVDIDKSDKTFKDLILLLYETSIF